MSLVGLRQYGSDYDDSSEDARRDEVPNSSSGDDAHDNADPESADDRAVKKIRPEDLYSSDDCKSDSSSMHTPAASEIETGPTVHSSKIPKRLLCSAIGFGYAGPRPRRFIFWFFAGAQARIQAYPLAMGQCNVMVAYACESGRY